MPIEYIVPLHLTQAQGREGGVGPSFGLVKRQVIVYFLDKSGGNICQAAWMMGLHHSSLSRMIHTLGLRPQLAAARKMGQRRRLLAKEEAARQAATLRIERIWRTLPRTP